MPSSTSTRNVIEQDDTLFFTCVSLSWQIVEQGDVCFFVCKSVSSACCFWNIVHTLIFIILPSFFICYGLMEASTARQPQILEKLCTLGQTLHSTKLLNPVGDLGFTQARGCRLSRCTNCTEECLILLYYVPVAMGSFAVEAFAHLTGLAPQDKIQ